uniref:Uncharacterized protein n=1 Tax=viral metagenome TaxID=1070528 RepID=A0A6M3JNZ1_9ZZZZ
MTGFRKLGKDDPRPGATIALGEPVQIKTTRMILGARIVKVGGKGKRDITIRVMDQIPWDGLRAEWAKRQEQAELKKILAGSPEPTKEDFQKWREKFLNGGLIVS